MTELLPLFPVNSVLFPGTNMLLDMFEPRYRQLIADLSRSESLSRSFGVLGIRDWISREITQCEQLQTVGCAADIQEVNRLAYGGIEVRIVGARKFRIVRVDARCAPYLIAEVTWVGDRSVSGEIVRQASNLASFAKSLHRRYRVLAHGMASYRAPRADLPVTELAYFIADDCPLSLEDRQHVLEEEHPIRRLGLVSESLYRELGMLRALRIVPLAPAAYRPEISLN